MAYGFFAFLPLILIGCCYKYCCGGGRGKDGGKGGRGEYRAIANTYGDASFDNAFSDNFSDDEDGDGDGDDLEADASWGKSNGRRVLEMTDLGNNTGRDDLGLSLEEMNG